MRAKVVLRWHSYGLALAEHIVFDPFPLVSREDVANSSATRGECAIGMKLLSRVRLIIAIEISATRAGPKSLIVEVLREWYFERLCLVYIVFSQADGITVKTIIAALTLARYKSGLEAVTEATTSPIKNGKEQPKQYALTTWFIVNTRRTHTLDTVERTEDLPHACC